MPKSKLQKMKLLFLLEMLRADSDEEHPIKTGEILARLGPRVFLATAGLWRRILLCLTSRATRSCP